MQLEKAVKTRKSVKKYSKKKANWRKIVRAIDLARFAPSAGNKFVLKFILIDDEGKIGDIAEACEQKFVSDVSHLVVAVSDVSKLSNFFGKRGEVYSRQQAGAGIENFLLGLNENGLSTCWVGHFDEGKIKKVLEIPKAMDIEAVFPIGKEAKMNYRGKSKIELDNILFFNKFGEKEMEPKTRVQLESL